jgi:hypothetical protein
LFVLLFLFAALIPVAAAAQTPIVVGDSVRVIAGARYAAGALQRDLFGGGWRNLWTSEIRVPVLDLGRTGGGLRPVERGGGFQTRSLEMAGQDGSAFRFRSVDKDPSQSLPWWFRLPGLVQMIRDQTSALLPGGALVAAELATAAGIPHSIPHLVVMPDDTRLGDFRAEFGGMLGTLEERHSPARMQRGRDGFLYVVGTDTLEALLHTSGGSGSTVDQREYLAARLLDFYLNDWDRHAGNWLWGSRDAEPPRLWVAIPKDRDQAFADYGGTVVELVRRFVPKLLPFTTEYQLEGLTVNAKVLDHSFLRGLPPPVWDSVAAALTIRLSDAAVDRALQTLPEPYYRLGAEELARTLRARRSGLPAAARAWARALAERD